MFETRNLHFLSAQTVISRTITKNNGQYKQDILYIDVDLRYINSLSLSLRMDTKRSSGIMIMEYNQYQEMYNTNIQYSDEHVQVCQFANCTWLKDTTKRIRMFEWTKLYGSFNFIYDGLEWANLQLNMYEHHTKTSCWKRHLMIFSNVSLYSLGRKKVLLENVFLKENLQRFTMSTRRTMKKYNTNVNYTIVRS